MKLIDKAIKLCGGDCGDWAMCGPAAVHKDAVLGARVKLLGPAILRRGFYFGGVYHGGVFHDGDYVNGSYYYGTFLNGIYLDGIYHCGTFHDGVFNYSPVQIAGICPWVVTIGKPGRISLGDECYTIEEWRSQIDYMARKNRLSISGKAKVMQAVDIAAEWMCKNPSVVVNPHDGSRIWEFKGIYSIRWAEAYERSKAWTM